MNLLTLLRDRYAVLRNLSDRSILVYSISLGWFDRYLATRTDRAPGPATLDDLDDLTVSAFLRWRARQTGRRGTISAASVAKDRCQILALWSHAAKKGLRNSRGEPVPFPALPPARVVRRIPVAYTLDELRRLLAAARARRGRTGALPSAWYWSTMLAAAYWTGERVGALLQLRWGQVDLARGRVVLLAETRKGGRADIARQLPAGLVAELAEHRGAPGDLVWPWPGNRLSIYPSLRLLCAAAKVTPRGFHAIRKASASYLAAAGGDATSHLGHRDPTIARDHYLDPRITERESAVDLLPPLDQGDEEASFVPDPEPGTAA